MSAPAFVTLNPNYIVPQTIMPIMQASDAFRLLADEQPQQGLSPGDLMVYVRRLDVRTRVAAGQATGNVLPTANVALSWAQAPTYMLRARAEFDQHDTEAYGRHGLSIQEIHSHAMRQGHFLLLRNMLLYGMNPANGEGLMNTPGAVTVGLPADSQGSQAVSTYNNGEMVEFINATRTSLKSRCYQLGIPRTIVMIGPQRVLGTWETQIVALSAYQQKGGGSQTVIGTAKDVLEANGDTFVWGYDDTLIGKGAGGTDAVIMCMPEVEQPRRGGINTNHFAKLAPHLDANTLMFTDRAAPTEIPSPVPGGATDVLSEMRATSGWGVRGEAITIMSMAY